MITTQIITIIGQDDIDIVSGNLARQIREAGSLTKEMVVLRMYSALPPSHLKRCFEPAPNGARKVRS